MKISNLQMTDAKSWSGITTRNHLGAIFEQKPQLASRMLTQMLTQSYGTSLDAMLSEIPAQYMPTNDEYTWKLIGNSNKNVPLVEARYQGSTVVSTDVGVGANGTEFELVFAERWFSDVNVIVGHKNEIYPVRIIADPYPEGTNWVYRCEMWGAVPSRDGMPGEELVAGKRFSKEYSPVESTLSIKGGEVGFVSPIDFRNKFSQIRMQYTVPGDMVKRLFAANFDYVDNAGKKQSFTTWMQYQTFVFEAEFAQEKNRLLWYGRATADEQNRQLANVGKSGNIISAGAGLREQMEVSNTFFYTRFSADLITNILLELSENKLPMDERRFVIRTGERGAVLFHRAIASEASGWTPLFDQAAQKQVSSNLHSNARAFGYQYVEYLAPNNISVRVEVDPMYGDEVRNKIMAPSDGHFLGGVAESYRMDILDIGSTMGEPNIQKVYDSSTPDITGYLPGLRDPFSPIGGRAKVMATPKDGFELHKFATCSVMLKDPARTASLIPYLLV